ncbi:DUF932 domain-containing protein [Jannaschia rubra]|uniref:DUF932 domain-containing protein n=1 Tax=Jannaschia rubra TaxID=282197 RepID=UPI0024913098|nr:DUF932 domain-containing protein [Jannaschia rubra]
MRHHWLRRFSVVAAYGVKPLLSGSKGLHEDVALLDGHSWEERDIAEAFFPVELRPVYVDRLDNSNDYRKLDRHFAVLDLERGHAFAVVTDDYKLITNQEAYGMAADAMKKVFEATKLEDLACLNITMPKSRSFCHIDLIHRNAEFSPWEEDKWSAFLRITNSYNRTRRLRFELGFCRWICLNGMIFGARSIEFSYAHTRRGMDQVHRFSDNIGDIRKLEAQLVEQLHQLKRFYVPKERMIGLFCRVFDLRVDGDAIKNRQRLSQLREIKQQVSELSDRYFDEMGPHGYAALNVLTDYATRPKGVISPEASINGLQQKASDWMQDFISAISKSSFSFDEYVAEYQSSADRLAAL